MFTTMNWFIMNNYVNYIFILILKIIKADEIDIKFARNYFKDQGIQHIAVFGCWNSSDIIEVFQSMATLDKKLSLIPISDSLPMKELLKVDYYKLGILLDLDCPNSEIILDQFISDRLPFNESYFWLLRMSDRSNEWLPLDLLDRLPLSINAEVTLAIRGHNYSDHYDLYDVYNPSYRHGGALNVTKMGYWNVQGGIRNWLTQYKYKRRGDLRGMHLNFSIVDYSMKWNWVRVIVMERAGSARFESKLII